MHAVITYFTLFNNLVPISLYVTMEMVNYVQAFFIDHDKEVGGLSPFLPPSFPLFLLSFSARQRQTLNRP